MQEEIENIYSKTGELDLISKYKLVRNHTEDICRPLHPEDYVPQPVPFISPPKWHLAHSSWFFETFILVPYLPEYEIFHSDFSFLFNSYYNHVGKRILRANRGNITRPSTETVYEYRKFVDEYMLQLLSGPVSEHVLQLVELGLNHEQQHQELLLTDIKYLLGHNPIFPVYNHEFEDISQKNSEFGTVGISEGIYEIGHYDDVHNKDTFCFDNELGRHKIYLHAFQIHRNLVTNKEYIAFIEAGGYQDFSLWLDEGWSWVQENQITAPLYWHSIDNQWYTYTLRGLKTVDPDSILAHVSFYEAAAFAQWKKKRLPTEFEWEVASSHLKWGSRWEWTNSAYLPYPGFQRADGAVGEYNGKFMINQMVLRGASVATPANHSRHTYRNFFHPHHRWQYTGIRLVD